MPPRVRRSRPCGMPRGLRIIGLAVCASLLGAACGGGGLSKEDFIAQADEICAQAEEKARDLAQPTDPAEVETYASSLEEITTDYIADLRELTPPEEDAQLISDLIEDIEQAGLKIVEATRTQAASGSPAEAYSEALYLGEDASERANDYGFEECGISEIPEHED